MGILKVWTFLDTKLSDLGVHNSVHGGYQLAEQCAAHGIPAPEIVVVSTMQRTFETSRYTMQGMREFAIDNEDAGFGWSDFVGVPSTIFPGIKEQGSGAENETQPALNDLTARLNTDNGGPDGFQVNANTLDATWITNHGSTWEANRNTESFSLFQEKLGWKLREHIGAVAADGADNTANLSVMAVTHSGQMKTWFSAFAGGEKPNNNDMWRFEYLRVPGLVRDSLVLISPVPTKADAAPALWRVGNYQGFRQRDATQMDVAPDDHTDPVPERLSEEHCERCGNDFMAWYARTGM